ncbi:MAG TPA: hypothetical protein VMH04_03900 [Candidatus Solibacter sp.]|nr:hypothetical protein [Candidatus Solibacter sp.]
MFICESFAKNKKPADFGQRAEIPNDCWLSQVYIPAERAVRVMMMMAVMDVRRHLEAQTTSVADTGQTKSDTVHAGF